MFGIGMTELIVIAVIALLVVGPKKLPELAKSLGRGLTEFKKATDDVTSTLNETIKPEDFKEPSPYQGDEFTAGENITPSPPAEETGDTHQDSTKVIPQ